MTNRERLEAILCVYKDINDHRTRELSISIPNTFFVFDDKIVSFDFYAETVIKINGKKCPVLDLTEEFAEQILDEMIKDMSNYIRISAPVYLVDRF
jgi:hypothetical protein